MKKILKILVLSLTIGLILISLTGCGANELVATKETENGILGKYNEEIVMKFKKDKIETIEMSMEFEEEEKAEGMYSLINLGMSKYEGEKLEGLDTKKEGKKIIITMDAKIYAETEEISDEEMTKEGLRKALEEDGYTVK